MRGNRIIAGEGAAGSGVMDMHLDVRECGAAFGSEKATKSCFRSDLSALSDFCWSCHVHWRQPWCLGRLVLAAESTAHVLFLTSLLQSVCCFACCLHPPGPNLGSATAFSHSQECSCQRQLVRLAVKSGGADQLFLWLRLLAGAEEESLSHWWMLWHNLPRGAVAF